MLKPLNNNILIKIIENDNMTKSGIILVDDNEKKYQNAQVMEICNIDNDKKIQVEKGQNIIIKANTGIEIKYENEIYLIIDQSDILAVIEG